MRVSEPRIPPLSDDEIPHIIQRIFAGRPVLNIFRTLAHHPDLMERWLVFGNHVLARSTLEPRHREMAILRIAWLCGSDYAWGQHALIALASGLTQEDIDNIPLGAGSSRWTALERGIISATDELHAEACVSDTTWQQLALLDVQQRLDLIFAVGQYRLVSMALNTLGVVVDPGLPALPR